MKKRILIRMLFLAISLSTSLSECMDTSPDNELQAPETITPKTSPSTRRKQISRSLDSSPKKKTPQLQSLNNPDFSTKFFIVEPKKEEQQNRRPSCDFEDVLKKLKIEDVLKSMKHNPQDDPDTEEMARKIPRLNHNL